MDVKEQIKKLADEVATAVSDELDSRRVYTPVFKIKEMPETTVSWLEKGSATATEWSKEWTLRGAVSRLDIDWTFPPTSPAYSDVPPLDAGDLTAPTKLPGGADAKSQIEYFRPHVRYAMMKRLNTIRHLPDGTARYLAALPEEVVAWLSDEPKSRPSGWLYAELLDALDNLDWD